MGSNDEVVDVGFGFADQDMLWMQRFAPRRITGLNATPSQVRICAISIFDGPSAEVFEGQSPVYQANGLS